MRAMSGKGCAMNDDRFAAEVQLRLPRAGHVSAGKYRIIGLASVSAMLLASPALAQQDTPSPAPTPAPSRPPVVTLPGADNFNLRPSGAQPTPAPTPTVAPPVVRVTPTPAARATPTPRATATPTPRATATPAAVRTAPEPAVAATPAPVATPTPAIETPAPTAAATPVAVPTAAVAAPPAEEGGFPWLWVLLGGVGLAAVGAGGWLLGRRGRAQDRDMLDEAPVPAPAPEPRAEPVPAPATRPVPTPAPPANQPVPAAPRQSPPPGTVTLPRAPQMTPPRQQAPRPQPARPQVAPEPIQSQLVVERLELGREGVIIDFQLLLNAPEGAQGARAAIAMISASADQDAQIAAYHARPPVGAAQGPFDLPRGEPRRLNGQIMLPSDRINVVQLGGRPMFVPIVIVDLRWNAGLSVRQHGADYMVGTEGTGGKLGPIWLDKQFEGVLATSRYVPKLPVAAA